MSEVQNSLLMKKVGKEDMENLVKVFLLAKEDDDESTPSDETTDKYKSKQLTEDPFGQMAAGEFVPPKFNPLIWAQTPEQNTRLSRCIRSFARNTVGLGWHIEPIHPITPETPDDEKKAVTEQTEYLRGMLNHPNEKMPLTEIFYLMKVDEETVGNGYLEVVRDIKGRIVRIYHAPATTMRVRIMKNAESMGKEIYGFIQIRGNQKRYFKEFGEKREMDALSGEWVSEGKKVNFENRATEIIHFKIYDPTSSFYGAPRYVSAAAAIAGNRMAAVRNVSFFDNDAVPRMALLVSGGRLTGESQKQIEDFFRAKTKGPDQAHRVVVIQVEPTKVGFQQQGKTMVEMKPLTVGVTEDASFQTYRNANDEEVREIFGLAPVFFSTENVNKASAAVSREITNEQEFEPDRLAKEYIINQTIVEDVLCAALGNNPRTPDKEDEMSEFRKNIRIQFRFARLTLTDPLDQARMDQLYSSMGALTPNELREKVGKPPYPKDYFFADKPIAVALAELSAGLALAIATDPEQKFPQPSLAESLGLPEAEAAGGKTGAEEGEKLVGHPDAPGYKQPKEMREVKPTNVAVRLPRPGQPAEVPKFQEEPKAAQPKGMGEKFTKKVFPPELAFSIVRELMSDARRLSQAGSDFTNGGRDGN